MDLHQFNLIVVNSSGGKDSLCALYEIARLAKEQGYPSSQVVVSHQCLQRMEWKGTKELAVKQAALFGFRFEWIRRVNKHGVEETLLDYVERRGKWPSSKQRYCTSDFKRGPGLKVITKLTKGSKMKVLQVFGFRKDESPSRAKKGVYKLNENASTQKRQVFDWLPIHDWSFLDVWCTIKANELPYHPAYDLGMPRLSCCFCIFAPFDALVIAGKENPDLLEEYVQTEKKIGHTFRADLSISSVQEAILNGYEPKQVNDWNM